MRALVIAVLILAAAPAIARAQRRSPSGRYEYENGASPSCAVVRVTDRRTRVVTTIDPNPGGCVPAGRPQVRWTAGDNLLVSWGCGTWCSEAVLFTPAGALLTGFSGHAVSPDGKYAVVYEAFGVPEHQDGEIQIISLRTGELVRTESGVDEWNVCRVRWARNRVLLDPCDRRTRARRIRIR